MSTTLILNNKCLRHVQLSKCRASSAIATVECKAGDGTASRDQKSCQSDMLSHCVLCACRSLPTKKCESAEFQECPTRILFLCCLLWCECECDDEWRALACISHLAPPHPRSPKHRTPNLQHQITSVHTHVEKDSLQNQNSGWRMRTHQTRFKFVRVTVERKNTCVKSLFLRRSTVEIRVKRPKRDVLKLNVVFFDVFLRDVSRFLTIGP
jgi:hypothetical protein